MAHVYSTRPAIVAHGAAAFVTAFTALFERFAKYRLYRQTLVELSAISPRERRDIGLSEHNLRDAAFEAVYGTR